MEWLIAILSLLVLVFIYIFVMYKTTGPGRKDAVKDFSMKEGKEKKLVKAYDIEIETEVGTMVHISNFYGKPIIINFWATWCPPCKAELPGFNKLYNKYGDRVNFLMINLTDIKREPSGSAKKYADLMGLNFPIYYDKKGFASEYALESIPDTFFIDSSGYIVRYAVGSISYKKIEDEIIKLLGE